jgi:PPIC-type PPIASE domain
MLKSLLREPLVHFLLLGAALFALDAWLRPTAATAANTEIVVSEARIRNLAQNFRRTWQRPPTREELDGLVESHVREEVLYREALALGLDRDDTIIRRRLQQKIEFISEEAAALAKPTDEELNAYLKANADAFRVEPRATFSQVYLDPRKRSSTLEADAKRLLAALNGGSASPDPAQLGDRLMMLEHRYEGGAKAEVARLFGNDFADALVKQPVGKWVGPIASGYGVHLVKVESLAAGGTPALDEVRPLVEREWANVRRQEVGKAFYERLRAKYAIKVQMPEAAKP